MSRGTIAILWEKTSGQFLKLTVAMFAGGGLEGPSFLFISKGTTANIRLSLVEPSLPYFSQKLTGQLVQYEGSPICFCAW